MEYTNLLKALLSELKGQRKALNKELKRLPQGKLMISSNGKRLSFFDIGGSYSRVSPKGIGRNPRKVQMLARKAYITEQLRRIDVNIALLEKALAGSLRLDTQALMDAMPKHFSVLDLRDLIHPEGNNEALWPNPVRDRSVYPRSAVLTLEGMEPQE